jgi:hypothetical protein
MATFFFDIGLGDLALEIARLAAYRHHRHRIMGGHDTRDFGRMTLKPADRPR